MNPFRSPLLRGYLLSILGLIVIFVSYFLPLFEGKCNEFSLCGLGPSLRDEVIAIFKHISTLDSFINFCFPLFLILTPLLLAILLVLLGWFYIRHKSRKLLNALLIIWTIGFIDFALYSLFMLNFIAYPIFGFWGIMLGYGILFYAYTIWGWHAKTNEQTPAQS